ncbi:hypothetical protein Q7P37_001056 [Cladosporium fusiforme]
MAPSDSKSLKNIAQEKNKQNPSQLGDPVSLRAETSETQPTPDDLGAKSDRKQDDGKGQKSLKQRAQDKLKTNPSQLGDPVSLKAETSDTEVTADDRDGRRLPTQPKKNAIPPFIEAKTATKQPLFKISTSQNPKHSTSRVYPENEGRDKLPTQQTLGMFASVPFDVNSGNADRSKINGLDHIGQHQEVPTAKPRRFRSRLARRADAKHTPDMGEGKARAVRQDTEEIEALRARALSPQVLVNVAQAIEAAALYAGDGDARSPSPCVLIEAAEAIEAAALYSCDRKARKARASSPYVLIEAYRP